MQAIEGFEQEKKAASEYLDEIEDRKSLLHMDKAILVMALLRLKEFDMAETRELIQKYFEPGLQCMEDA